MFQESLLTALDNKQVTYNKGNNQYMSVNNNNLIYINRIFDRLTDITSHDQDLQKCILGNDFESIMNDKDNFSDNLTPDIALTYSVNIITLVGLFLYSKFNFWRSKENDRMKIPNAIYLDHILGGLDSASEFIKPSASLRVLRLLNNIYTAHEMGFSVLDVIITNFQIESGLNYDIDQKAGLTKLLGFPSECALKLFCKIGDNNEIEKIGTNLLASLLYIKSCKSDSNKMMSENITNKIYQVLDDFLSVFDFLKRVNLKINDNGEVDFLESYNNRETEIIPSNNIFKIYTKPKGKDYLIEYTWDSFTPPIYFFLENITYEGKTSTCKLKYRSFDETQEIAVIVHDDNSQELYSNDLINKRVASVHDFYNSFIGCVEESGQEISHKDMFALNQGLLTNAISDAIDLEIKAKCQLLKIFVRKDIGTYSEIFEPVFEAAETIHGSNFDKINKMKDVNKRWEMKIDIVHNILKDYGQGNQRFIDWDLVIDKILVNNGVDKLLTAIFIRDEFSHKATYSTIYSVFNNIIEGISLRITEKAINDKSFIETIFEKQNIISEKYYRDLTVEERNLPNKQLNELKCKILIDSYIEAMINTLNAFDLIKVEGY